MSVITMRDAKRDFSLGYLTRFAIGRSIQNLGEWTFLSDARTKQTRTFKSLDTAVKALEEIGFEVDVLEKR